MPIPSLKPWVVTLALLATGAWGVISYYRPPLRVDITRGLIRVDVQTLGEYPTRVAKIRVIDDESNDVVWEVRSRGLAQLSTFEFSVGENPRWLSGVTWGRYEVVRPRDSSFLIAPGRRYVLEVWGADHPLTRSRVELRIPLRGI